MAGTLKRILQSSWAVRLAADAIALYVRLVRVTSRWETRGEENIRAFWDNGKPCIVAFWHGRLLMMPPAWRTERKMHVLISQHRDGELIARAMDRFGILSIRGSSAKRGQDKGGGAALRGIVQTLKRGDFIGFTPDGPRGPRMRASLGVVAAARLGKVPVVPICYGVARRHAFRSWDRFLLPWPFNRGITIWGEPIDVSDTHESLEEAALRVEAAMNAMADECDRLCNAETIAPAEIVLDDAARA